MAKPLKNLAASVRQRLLNRAHERGEDYQLTLIHYAVERLLYRLSRSSYRDRFVLKGAILLTVWSGTPYRATRDLDLLGRGDNSVKDLEAVFRAICHTPVQDDGLEFVIDSLHGEDIAEDQEYQGVRLSFQARLAGARIPLQVDIGFGDAVQPEAEALDYPSMLGLPGPRLLAYPREAVVAEKFQAMVRLGISNTRMKDFYDVWFLSQQFTFDGRRLSQAIRTTFDRRRTALPASVPLALTSQFSEGRDKQAQWIAFLKRTGLGSEKVSLATVVEVLRTFLLPPTDALEHGQAFDSIWSPKGPWQRRS